MIRHIHSQQEWDGFVLPLNPNTFLQSWEWGQTQRSAGEKAQYLGIWKNDKHIGVAVFLTIYARRGIHYLIPHGPIVADPKDYEYALQETINYARQSGHNEGAVALRVAPLVENIPATMNMFKQHGFKPAPLHIHAELTWIVPLEGTTDELLHRMRKTTRHAIRKATRAGIQAEIVSAAKIVDRFWILYEATSNRHNFVQYSKGLIENQVKEFSTRGRVFGAVATYQGRDIAAAIIFQYGHTCFYYHGASIQVPKQSPTQLLQFSVMEEAKRRGALVYNMWGIAPEDKAGKKQINHHHPFSGITIFKKGFGGFAIDYAHAQDFPLTWRYYILWLIESFRKYRRGF